MRKKTQKLARSGPCRVYWGSHGCSKQRGHLGRHYCGSCCYAPDPEQAIFYGEDWDGPVNRWCYPCQGMHAEGQVCPTADLIDPEEQR